MNLRPALALFGVAVLWAATPADAKVHRVYPGDNLQAAVDAAEPGDTILVEPGVYVGTDRDYGLRVTTENLRLIGKSDDDSDSDSDTDSDSDSDKVRLVHAGDQQTGVYAAPDGCGPSEPVGGCLDDGDQPRHLDGFYIRGFTVENFPRNGIQTRFVKNFKIIRNESANNGRINGNGIYPTISAHGLVAYNTSYGSKDTAAWVAASQDVLVMGNEFYGSVIGFEISVSDDVIAKDNKIHHNTVGVALIHPNGAGNDPLPVMEDWVIKNNDVYANNMPNNAPDGSFQQGLPSGAGILVLGVSNHEVSRNTVEDNDFVGIGVVGWCSATSAIPGRDCISDPPVDRFGNFQDPSVSNNLVSKNKVRGNGDMPPGDGMGGEGPLDFLAADITYFSFWPDPPFGFPVGPETSSGNCFEKNKPKDGFSISAYDLPPDFGGMNTEMLPDDGC